MPNEFESEVRKKLEELNFVPSAPVWDKIEEQIRKKKERKRGLIWFPLLGLLLAGGIWFTEATSDNRMHDKMYGAGKADQGGQDGKSTLKQEEVKKGRMQEAENGSESPEIINAKSGSGEKGITVIEERIAKESPSAKPGKNGVRLADRPGEMKVGGRIGKMASSTYSGEHLPGETTISNPGKNLNEIGVQPVSLDRSEMQEQSRHTSAILSEKNMVLPSIEPKIFVPVHEPVVQQSGEAVVQGIVDKRDARKWRFGIHAMAGASGSGKGLSFLDNQKSMADPAAAPPMPPLVNYYNEPSPVVNGPSFSVGFSARKRIGNRMDFITGIQYEYYSTRHEVGIRINQRSSNAGVSSGLNQYYINYGSTLQQYLNQYHFISLPIAIAVQPFGSLPVEIQGGISVKQLVKTNALKYDSNIEAYYFDRSAFHNTQFFAGASVSYAFLDHSLLAGPCFEYGFTSPQKQGDGQRLFAYGLKLQYIFRKK